MEKTFSKDQLQRIGRDREVRQIHACLSAERNVLLEGPVGVGKTFLAQQLASEFGRPVFRIDGDSRYSEQKLAGWFDPPLVIQKGYTQEAFIPGPLTEAMTQGGVLFINELNRLPEGVQNVLLPAIDERKLSLPRLGLIEAQKGFLVIATQNPKEFVATSHLSEAILDRFERIVLDYQTEKEEREILKQKISDLDEDLCHASVCLVRTTRDHARIKRGASVRAALAVAELTQKLCEEIPLEDAFAQAAEIAIPTRIEWEHDSSLGEAGQNQNVLKELAEQALDKKKA